MMRRRRGKNIWEAAVIGALVLAGIVLLFLIPAVVWLVALGLLGGIGIMCLIRSC